MSSMLGGVTRAMEKNTAGPGTSGALVGGGACAISCVVLRGFPAKVPAEHSCREWRSQPWRKPGEEGSRKRGQTHNTLSCAGKDHPLQVRTEWVPPSCVWYLSKRLPLLMACQIHEGEVCFVVFFPLNIVAPAPVHCLACDGCPINTCGWNELLIN